MQLELIGKAEVLAAMERNGTRPTKIAEVKRYLVGRIRLGRTDKYTVIVTDHATGVAARTRYADRADEPDADRGMSIAACGLLR